MNYPYMIDDYYETCPHCGCAMAGEIGHECGEEEEDET